MTGLEEAVRHHPLFRGLEPALVHAAVRGATEREAGAGELLAHEGSPAESLFLVLSGKVALQMDRPDGGALTVQTVGAGEVVGWSWLVPPHRWRFDVRAMKASRALVLDGGSLREALQGHPAAGFQFLLRFLPLLAERLENTRLQLMDLHAR